MPRAPKKSNVVKMPAPAARAPAFETTQDTIARRAYEIYLSRGGADGHDIDDWLDAERELQDMPVREMA